MIKEYTIVDHLITVGTMQDPVDEANFRREFNKHWFRRLPLVWYKPYRLHLGDCIESGLRPDEERANREHANRINCAPAHIMDYFTAKEAYILSGYVVIECPRAWGKKVVEGVKPIR